MTLTVLKPEIPHWEIRVEEAAGKANPEKFVFNLQNEFKCDPGSLSSYNFADWEPVIADAMVVAAAIEYADGRFERSKRVWERKFHLTIPVSEPDRWQAENVLTALVAALKKLTGDSWQFKFIRRQSELPRPIQGTLQLKNEVQTVMPYSGGLDSVILADLLHATLKGNFLRVQLGPKSNRKTDRLPFNRVPYAVRKKGFHETSARSRGFKFTLVSGLAAYLTGAKEIALPESGQGIFGPVFDHPSNYPDYRNHPSFTMLMEQLLKALLGLDIKYVFPGMWNTKGQTLSKMLRENPDANWQATKSCWMKQRMSSIGHKLRQCGICAACMLRRISVHSSNLSEARETYVCNNMNASDFINSFDEGYSGRHAHSYRGYAIAGIRHMDELAALAGNSGEIERHARLLEYDCGFSHEETAKGLRAVFDRHTVEWKGYLGSLHPDSFVRQWSQVDP